MALKDFRVSGMIRNKSLKKDGRGGQVESWKGVHAKWLNSNECVPDDDVKEFAFIEKLTLNKVSKVITT